MAAITMEGFGKVYAGGSRAIVREPAAFLFDEPLSNLDTKLRITMRLEIKALQRRLRTTSLYVTHDQVEAMTLADRLVVLNAGRVEQIVTPLEVYHRPASTSSRASSARRQYTCCPRPRCPASRPKARPWASGPRTRAPPLTARYNGNSAGGAPAAAVTGPDFDPGTVLRLGVAPDDLHLFDGQTGLRR